MLEAFHAQRLAETDPHGLTQGMAQVEVRLRRLAQAEVQQLDAVLRRKVDRSTQAGLLRVKCAELQADAVVRRGVVIVGFEAGLGWRADAGEGLPARSFSEGPSKPQPRAAHELLRPCDVLLLGDVLLAVNGERVDTPWAAQQAVIRCDLLRTGPASPLHLSPGGTSSDGAVSCSGRVAWSPLSSTATRLTATTWSRRSAAW